MSFADAYFSKQQGILNHIPDPPSYALRYCVIIPAFREEKIITVLESLWHCTHPEGAVEVIIVVNNPVNAAHDIREASVTTLSTIENWSHNHHEEGFRFYTVNAIDMPIRHAGVGLARKTGMDEAVWRFNSISCPEGLLISLDADCLCDVNYFAEIEKNFKTYPRANGFNLYFEHPVTGQEFSGRIYEGIIQYELHMRYYVHALRYAGFPYAYHTVGSCYAVKALTYIKQGGMNRRKSGEDFYFLHKIIPLGNFFEINTTRVIPSSRPSLRVPFGTGPTLHKYLLNRHLVLQTYNPDLFEMLQDVFSMAPEFYQQPSARSAVMYRSLHPVLVCFLDSIDGQKAIAEINANCNAPETFIKRFYNWFDAFTVLKFLNYASAGNFPRINVSDASLRQLKKQGYFTSDYPDDLRLLLFYREKERKETWVSPLQQ